jgi:hypothetical protein
MALLAIFLYLLEFLEFLTSGPGLSASLLLGCYWLLALIWC